MLWKLRSRPKRMDEAHETGRMRGGKQVSAREEVTFAGAGGAG